MLTRMNGRRSWIGGLMGIVLGGVAAGSAGPGCTGDHDTRVIAADEGGLPAEGGRDGASGPTCPSDIPIDPSSLLWKPPYDPQEGKCQDADVVAMKEFLAANPTASNEDFENFVKNRNKTCHDCVFGDAAGQRWPPAPVRNGVVFTFNVGACYALTTGNQPCGEAVQNAWDCGFEACVQCDSQTSLAGCRATVRSTLCKTYEDKAHALCGAPSIDEVCGTPFDSIRVQCVTTVHPVTDGGADAADDAADQ
jgi:hypothetical protein